MKIRRYRTPEKYMLTSGNSDLRSTGIYTWSIPAYSVKLTSGKTFQTCPMAGACASLCYARSGTYQFSNVKAAHVANLERVLDDRDRWQRDMIAELRHPRYRRRNVRIHDSGDFFDEDYFTRWLYIVAVTPRTFFYAYTKQVALIKRHRLPDNLRVIFSLGGKEDHLVDRDVDRHSDVFPNHEVLVAAGYTDQEDDDLLAAVMENNRVGIVANNIPHLLKKQGGETFGTMEAARRVKVELNRSGRARVENPA